MDGQRVIWSTVFATTTIAFCAQLWQDFDDGDDDFARLSLPASEESIRLCAAAQAAAAADAATLTPPPPEALPTTSLAKSGRDCARRRRS